MSKPSFFVFVLLVSAGLSINSMEQEVLVPHESIKQVTPVIHRSIIIDRQNHQNQLDIIFRHTGITYSLEEPSLISWVRFSPDDTITLVGYENKRIGFWSTKTSQWTELKGHTAVVRCVAFSSDSSKILTGSGDNTACLWDVSTGKRLWVFEGHTNGIISVAYSPDEKTVLTASLDDTARLWDVSTGKQLHLL